MSIKCPYCQVIGTTPSAWRAARDYIEVARYVAEGRPYKKGIYLSEKRGLRLKSG